MIRENKTILVVAVCVSFFSPPSENNEGVPVIEVFVELAGRLPNNPPPPNKLEPLAVPDVDVVVVAEVVLGPGIIPGLDKLNNPLPAGVPTAGVAPELPLTEKTGSNSLWGAEKE